MSEGPKKLKFCVSNPAFKNIKMDMLSLERVIDAVYRPGWYKDASGFAEAKELASAKQHTILLACVDYTGCDQYWSNCLKTEVFDQNEFGWWVFKKGLILVQLNGNLTELYEQNDMETQQLVWDYFMHENTDEYYSIYGAAAARIDSDGKTCLGLLPSYTPGTGVMKWIADFENATQMNRAIFRFDKNLYAAPVIPPK